LKITLDKTYQKNQDYTVYIKYTARPNEVKQEGSMAINDAKVFISLMHRNRSG
jgi:aminopeptidase N